MQALDVLQAASNAVAGNVTGPVDILSLLLRKIGVPVPENALGSSQWAREHGLLRDVDDPYARAAGESLGIIAPMVAAAKAPQIARGLLQAGDNLAAPRTLNPQTGAIVWHGSPYKFYKFNSSKIGTGEGAQAYGHGLYLAETPEVAQTYRTAGSDAQYSRFTGGLSPIEEYAFDRAAAGATGDNLFSQVWSRYGSRIKTDAEMDALAAAIKRAEQGAGNLYKVDLPDSAIARMLDWDAPLSQQPKAVQDAFEGMVSTLRAEMAKPAPGWGDLAAPGKYDPTGQELLGLLRNRNADNAQAFLGNGLGADVSANLRQKGIPGIRYLDGGSRGAGSGTSNYVVFPGEEALLTILERNGIPLP